VYVAHLSAAFGGNSARACSYRTPSTFTDDDEHGRLHGVRVFRAREAVAAAIMALFNRLR
jgi:hypothetical protein